MYQKWWMKILFLTCQPRSLKLTYSSCFLHPSLEIPRLSEIENMQMWCQSWLIKILSYDDEFVFFQAPVAASTAFSASWTVLWGLERLDWRPFWPWAERTLRNRTSLVLKKTTKKGCLSWGTLPVTKPASREFLLWPTGGDKRNYRLNAPKTHISIGTKHYLFILI